jgi:hypothetical protein
VQLVSRRPRFQLCNQSKNSVCGGKSASGRCRQQRPIVVPESRYLPARSSGGHRTIRPEPERLTAPQLPYSWGRPRGLDFDAAEVYAPVYRLRLWPPVEKELFFGCTDSHEIRKEIDRILVLQWVYFWVVQLVISARRFRFFCMEPLMVWPSLPYGEPQRLTNAGPFALEIARPFTPSMDSFRPLFLREVLLPSTLVCLRGSAPRWYIPSPPIHGQRMRWRVNACSCST